MPAALALGGAAGGGLHLQRVASVQGDGGGHEHELQVMAQARQQRVVGRWPRLRQKG